MGRGARTHARTHIRRQSFGAWLDVTDCVVWELISDAQFSRSGGWVGVSARGISGPPHLGA